MASRKEWKEQKINLSHAIIAAALALVGGVFIGLGWNAFAPYLGLSGVKTGDWSALDEVYAKLSANYDGEIDTAVLIDGAKHGMVAALGDPYTEYLNYQEASDLSDDLHGKVGAGIGVEFGLRDGYVRVLRTLPDNPARRAGVLAGDIIYMVDGEDVHALSSEAISAKLRGEPGTEVTLTVFRDGDYLDFTMSRETINNVSAYVDYRGDTAILTLTRFDSDTGSIATAYAKEFIERGVTKVILDLRGNGGGYVSAARDLISLWVDGEVAMVQRSARQGEDDVIYAYTNRAILKDMKTVVLVNSSTASASEIVTGALKDYGKATVIGEPTYGKGVIQTLLNLSAGAQLKVTTARWYTPKGTSIDQSGIAPDLEVVRSYADINAMRDPQLDKALEL